MLDRRGRSSLVHVTRSNLFESQLGNYPASDLTGQDESVWITTNKGHRLMAVRPTLSDLTLRMPRLATVMYPKDLGAMLFYADIFPGARVLEAGTGSGALTMTLLRAVGDRGRVFTYDLRQDMIEQAEANVARYFDIWDNLEIKIGDVLEGIEEDDLDRVILDLPEPWHLVPHDELVKTLRSQRTFGMIETNGDHDATVEREWSEREAVAQDGREYGVHRDRAENVAATALYFISRIDSSLMSAA